MGQCLEQNASVLGIPNGLLWRLKEFECYSVFPIVFWVQQCTIYRIIGHFVETKHEIVLGAADEVEVEEVRQVFHGNE